MVRTAALLLLLAAAANLQMSAAASDFTDCPISYYGKEYTSLEVILTVESGSICFRENQAATHDCIDVGYVSNVDDYSVTLNQGHKDLTPHLASITDTSTCSVTIAFKDGPTSIAWVKLYRAESKAALSISYNSDADHEGAPSSLYVKTINGKSIALSQGDLDGKEHYLDISGCRSSGYTVAAGSEKKVSSTCTTISCSEHLVAAETGCDSGMICMLGTCVPENPGFAAPGGGDADDNANTVVCTVTGSSVINFFNTKQDIPDRCAYTLLKPLSGSDFELVAVFKERRRKDVTLLDHLIISYSGKKIYLGQGVRAQVDDTDLQLSDQFETHHNVELRKDSSGVTAKIPSTGMKVVFDGNTAHLSGLDNEAVQGLCGTPTLPSATTSPSNEKSSDSETGCDIPHSDDSEDPICSTITTHCELLKQAPFDSCNSHIEAQPYIDACKNVLCQYPQVDGLKCQFFVAYAGACKLKKDITVDWALVDGCSADPLPCWDQYCSEDEFCGEIPGGTRCFCRALFSAKYEPTKALGDSTTCTANSATLTLAKCLLEDVNVDYNNLHLKDPNCKGVLDPKTHLVTFSFDDGSKQCGTDVEKVDDIITYSNAVMDQDPDDDAIIIRHDQVRIDFSCTYRKPEIQSFPFRIASGSVTRTVESQDWSYTLTMSAYIDPDFKQLITDDTEIQLNQRVWVKLMTSGLDDTMVTVVTQSCWATSEDNNQALLKHFLISNGCPDDGDSTVQVEGNGVGTSNSFSFSMFQFTSGSGQIYLHCELELCLIGGDTPCAKSCGSLSKKRRRRRSSRSKYDRNPAVITMAWNR